MSAEIIKGRRSLQSRFMAMVIGGASAFAAIAGTVAYDIEHDRALATSRSTVQDLAVAVEKTVAAGLFARDPVLLREVAAGLSRNGFVAGVDVVDAGGDAVISLSGGSERSSVSPSTPTTIERTLVSPFDASEPLGTLRIRVDDARVDSIANRDAAGLAIAMMGQAALVALLVYLVAARLVSRPIVRLAGQLHLMTPGGQERLPIPPRHAHDEIGLLIGSTNALLDANESALLAERTLRAEIAAMEAQYRQIFDASSAGIFVLDGAGRLINGNPTVARLIGVPVAQLRELKVDNFIDRVFEHPEQARKMILEAAERGETVSSDLQLRTGSDVRRWVHCLISVQGQHAQRKAGDPAIEGVVYDITERKSHENAVRHRAEHDALTGLKNRGASHAMLERFVEEATASGAALSVVCLDLDGFKAVNDSHGHHSGDEVLRACADRMRSVIRRSSDLVGRLGGDEFVIALRDVGPDDAILAQTTRDLLDALCEPIALTHGAQARISASVGVACLPRHGRTATELLGAADAAMYRIKRDGKRAIAIAAPA